MMPAVEIIHLSTDQWTQYRDIRLEALQNAPQAFSTTYQQMVDMPASFWQDRLAKAAVGVDSWLLFARVEQSVVGLIGAFLSEMPETAVIVSVYVRPQFRGTGVSQALMEGILAELRHRHITTAELSVTQGQAAAMGLYAHFGFVIREETSAMMGDGQVHVEYRMTKHL